MQSERGGFYLICKRKRKGNLDDNNNVNVGKIFANGTSEWGQGGEVEWIMVVDTLSTIVNI